MHNFRLIFITIFMLISYKANANEALEIKQMQQELKHFNLEQENKNLDYKPQYLEFLPENTNLKKSTCLNIKTIEINGSTLFSAAKLQDKVKDFSSKCTTLSDIQKMLNHLNALYFKYGYVTSRANLPMPQSKLAEHILIIQITEGKISQITLNENQNIYNQKLKLASSVPTKQHNILNIRDLEQAIDNFANVNNSKSKFIIEAGKEIGTSKVIINNEYNKPHYISASLDNSGTGQTGKNKYNLSANFSDLLNLNENISFNYNSLYKRQSYKRQSAASSFNYSLPLKNYLLNYSLSRSNYILGTNLTRATYYSLGNTTINKISLERNIFRNNQVKIKLTSDLTHKNVKSYNKIFNIKLVNQVGTRKLAIANIGIHNTIYSKYGTLIIKPSYKFGLDKFSALNDKTSEYSEEAQYEAYNLYLYYHKIFSQIPLKYNLNIEAQKSEDILFSSEAFYAGGEYSVRGFKEEYIQGDSGFYARNDFTLNKNLAPYIKLNNSSLNTSLFFDYGLTKANIDDKNYQVSGAGIKVNFYHKLFSANITYSKALKIPVTITENEVIYAKISKAISF
ncbi:MAG: ShlB/FhaC/HecB family hemolysin secretion/activation protein [Alphaproteobacteria bacterium]|jgi:hemolysin activation/secretion protein|nr:ShlB/FhaC/HecB family hemolysin secretion/activation protein [Alphaproteobacteria bacterium]